MKKVLVTITAMVLAVVMIGGCGAKAEAQKKDADSKKESSTMAMLEKPAEDRSLERSVSGLTKAVIEKQDERDAWLRSDSYDPDDYYDYARRVVVDADIAKYERLLETAKDNLAAKEAHDAMAAMLRRAAATHKPSPTRRGATGSLPRGLLRA